VAGNNAQADRIDIFLLYGVHYLGCLALENQEGPHLPSIHRGSVGVRSAHCAGDLPQHVAHTLHGTGRMGCVGDAADLHGAGFRPAVYHHGTSLQRIVVALLRAHDHLQLEREEIKTHALVGPCVDPCLWHRDVGRWPVPNVV